MNTMNKDYGKAVIMMATYNGEKYLKQQLESLQKQTFKNWDLYVSDDCSTDNTISLLKNFQNKDHRLKKVISNTHDHGAFNNYANIMYFVKKSPVHYDYYFYCDQDDIWQKNKMHIEIEKINQNKNYPYLCYSNLELIDSNGFDLHKTMNDETDIVLKNPYNIFFSYRYIWGTTMAHNYKLWDKMKILPNRGLNISHDNYVGKTAAIFGKIDYIDTPLVFYRRHGNNVSDIPGKYDFIDLIKRSTVKLPTIINNHAQIYWDDLLFIKDNNVSNKFLSDLEVCIEKGGITSLCFLKKYNINTSKKKLSQISIKTILFLKLYKLSPFFTKKHYRKYEN